MYMSQSYCKISHIIIRLGFFNTTRLIEISPK